MISKITNFLRIFFNRKKNRKIRILDLCTRCPCRQCINGKPIDDMFHKRLHSAHGGYTRTVGISRHPVASRITLIEVLLGRPTYVEGLLFCCCTFPTGI